MATEMNKEQWIDAVMSSTRGMRRAEPAPDLFARIQAGLNGPERTIMVLPIRQWAAAAIILLAVNIGSIVYFMDKNRAAQANSQSNPIAAELQQGSTYNY